jgi:hypothetical protein
MSGNAACRSRGSWSTTFAPYPLPPLPFENLAAYLPVQRYQFPVDRQRGTLPRLLDAGLRAGEPGDIVSGDERHFSHTVLLNTSGNCRLIEQIINVHRRGDNCFRNALA